MTRRSEQSDAGQRTVCLLSVSTCPRCQEDGTESRQRRQAHGKSCRPWSAAGDIPAGLQCPAGGCGRHTAALSLDCPQAGTERLEHQSGESAQGRAQAGRPGSPRPGRQRSHGAGGGGVSRRVPQSLPPPPLSGTRTACGDHVTLLFTCSLTCGSSPTHQEVPAQTGPPSPPNPRAGFPLSQPEPSSPCFCLLVELPKTMEGNAFC